jgi:NDP-sugar pyrophosphorylase family protein
MKAFILAAGLGTRLRPLTEDKPKALIEINGKTLLEITIERLKKFGFDHIIINVHHFADQMIDYLHKKNYFDIDIRVSNEIDLLLDTGGGLKNASWFFENSGPFLIHNVDIISDLDLFRLYNYHIIENPAITLAVQNRISSRYFLFDSEKTLCGWMNAKNKKTIFARKPVGQIRELAFSGIHIASPTIFSLMPDKNVFSIVELYLSIASVNRITYFEHTESFCLDLGKKENIAAAEKFLSSKN